MAGYVMLAATGGRPARARRGPGPPGLARPPRPGAITRCYITVGLIGPSGPRHGPGPGLAPGSRQ